MDLLGSLAGGLVSGVGSLIGGANANAQSAKNVQEQALYNSYAMAQAQAYNVANASTAWDRSQQAATTAWDRGTQAATTAYDRDLSMMQNQQAYETNMSNTAYQRQTADMMKAGLNPILAAGGGGGASTPAVGALSAPTASGPAASASSPSSGPLGVSRADSRDILSPAISNALQGSRLSAELDNLTSTNKQIENQAKLTGESYKTQRNYTDKAAGEAAAAQKAPDLVDAQIEQARAGAAASSAQAAKTQVDANQTYREGTGDVTNLKTWDALINSVRPTASYDRPYNNPPKKLGGNSTVYGSLYQPDDNASQNNLNWMSPPFSLSIGQNY